MKANRAIRPLVILCLAACRAWELSPAKLYWMPPMIIVAITTIPTPPAKKSTIRLMSLTIRLCSRHLLIPASDELLQLGSVFKPDDVVVLVVVVLPLGPPQDGVLSVQVAAVARGVVKMAKLNKTAKSRVVLAKILVTFFMFWCFA